jgi:hypothetical protein
MYSVFKRLIVCFVSYVTSPQLGYFYAEVETCQNVTSKECVLQYVLCCLDPVSWVVIEP